MSWFIPSEKEKDLIKCKQCRVKFPSKDFAANKDCPQCKFTGEEKRIEITPFDPDFCSEEESLERSGGRS